MILHGELATEHGEPPDEEEAEELPAAIGCAHCGSIYVPEEPFDEPELKAFLVEHFKHSARLNIMVLTADDEGKTEFTSLGTFQWPS